MKKNQSGVDTMMKKIYSGDASHTRMAVRQCCKDDDQSQ